MRHASHTSAITKQYRPAFSTNGGSSFTNLNSHSVHIGSSNWGDDHIAYSLTNAINMGGEGASFANGVIFTPLAKTSNSSYGFQLGGCGWCNNNIYCNGDKNMSELNFTHSNGNKVKLTTPDTLNANKTFKLH